MKLRPFGPSSLDRWRDVHDVPGGELRVEGDWTGATHVTAASVVVEQGPDEVAAAVARKRPLRKLFSRDQEDFLAEQAAMPVEFERLRAYGPVTAVKWEPAARGFLRDRV